LRPTGFDGRVVVLLYRNKEITKFTNSSEWNTGDPHELYIKLYKKVISFDKHIARRYNDLTGSRYLMTVFSLFQDGVLTTEDIAHFDVEAQNEMLRMKKNMTVIFNNINNV